jgi:peroxiredoxin
MADYSKFQDLNVQILGIGSGMTFAQKTFADSLKLPYPLLSDFPDLNVIRGYGVLAPSKMDAQRAFFLVDQQGIVRARWLPDDKIIFPSEPILDAVRAISGKR